MWAVDASSSTVANHNVAHQVTKNTRYKSTIMLRVEEHSRCSDEETGHVFACRKVKSHFGSCTIFLALGPHFNRIAQRILIQRGLFAQFFRMLRRMFFRADQKKGYLRRVAQSCAILQQDFSRP